MQDFRNRVALITGASSGIGEALALALAREGAKLVLVARDRTKLEAVRERCTALGAAAEVFTTDIGDEQQVRKLAEAVHATHPAVDILINNAGAVMAGLLVEVELSDWQRLYQLNVMGVVHVCQAFLPKMIARQQGQVVMMASAAGIAGQRGMSTYSATKFALLGLSESLRAELHRQHVGVSVICPSYVQTPIEQKVKLVGTLDSERTRASIAAQFRRGLKPEQVAARTLRAIRRNEALVTIGRDAQFAKWLKRLAPGLLERVLRG